MNIKIIVGKSFVQAFSNWRYRKDGSEDIDRKSNVKELG